VLVTSGGFDTEFVGSSSPTPHPAGCTDKFGAELAGRAVTTLTYVAGDQTKAIAAIFAL
jgi:acyl-ACP thioesterase